MCALHVSEYTVLNIIWLKEPYSRVHISLLFSLQLVSSLAQEAPHVTIDQIHITNVGWCLRFNPLVSAGCKFNEVL